MTRGNGSPERPLHGLLKYIAEVSRIRSELFDYVSTGELADASDRTLFFGKPQVECRGSFAGSPDAEWTLFRRRADGRLCAVLGNLGGTALVASRLKFGGKRPRPCRILAPFARPRASKLPATVTVPPERVVFVVEE